MNPPPDKYPMHLTACPNLVTAFIEYMVGRDLGGCIFVPSLAKDAATQKIFNEARQQWGDKIVYMERCAASFMFHVKVRTNIERATVFAIHLLLEHKTENEAFTKLKYCDWANNLQTIPNGTEAHFNEKGLIISGDLPVGLKRYQGFKCTVVSLAVATQLGEKMF